MIDRLPQPRWWRATVLAVIAVVALLVLGTAGPASAHATLVSSDPTQGAVLDAAPERIRFTFSEAVVGAPDGVQVFDAQGGLIASSAAVSGAELDVTLSGDVSDGTLVVVWRVVSADGHPISGSLSFSVGAPSADVTQPPTSPATSGATAESPWTLKLTRWVGYVGLLLTGGLVGFTVLFVPTSHLANSARRRLVVTARTGAATTAVAWLAALPLTALYQLGGDAGALTRSSTWSTLSPTEYGVTVAVVAGVGAAIGLLDGGQPHQARRMATLAAGVVAVCAPAMNGHTRVATPEVLAIAADMLHLLAGSVWLGGLVGLALAMADLSGRGTMAADVLARFSAVAAGLLVALVATGSVLTWRIVGSWSALVATGYGQLLLVKITLALVAVLIAAFNRFKLMPLLLRATRRRERRAGAGPLVRTTVAEAGVLVAVLLLTGILVDRSPEADAAADGSRTGVQTAMLGPFTLQATVSPLTAGSNTVTIETRDATGEPIEGLEAPRMRLSSGQVDLGSVAVINIGPGTYTAEVVLPSPGTWQVQVSLRMSKFDNPVTTLDFTVAGG